MASELDLSQFWCWNKDCKDYGIKEKGNIVLKERYEKKNRALLRCKTCNHCFSESRDTIFFGLDTLDEEILRTLAMIPEKGSIRGVARATGHDKNAVSRWLDIAGAHCKEVTEYFLQNAYSMIDIHDQKGVFLINVYFFKENVSNAQLLRGKQNE